LGVLGALNVSKIDSEITLVGQLANTGLDLMIDVMWPAMRIGAIIIVKVSCGKNSNIDCISNIATGQGTRPGVTRRDIYPKQDDLHVGDTRSAFTVLPKLLAALFTNCKATSHIVNYDPKNALRS